MRTTRRLALAVCALGLAGTAALVLSPGRPYVQVVVDGRAVDVAGRRPTVADALRAAGRTPRDGAVRSAGSGTVLRPGARPAVITVDGGPASRSTRLAEGARVAVTDGTDVVEPTEARQVEVPAPPGPEVETVLWYPGAPGVDEVVSGAISGEVVDRRPVVAPVPPRREEGNVVALTFDDGPSPTYTAPILQVLAEEAVPATFCLVGDMVRKRPELTRTIAGHGHALCSHTMHHLDRLDLRPPEQVEREVAEGVEVVGRTTERPVLLFRAPGGRTTPAMLDSVRRRGMRALGWTFDASDAYDPDPAVHVQRIVDGLRPGSVVLLHDGGGDRTTTMAILRPLVQALKARGWQFATPLAPPAPAPAPPPPPAAGPAPPGPPSPAPAPPPGP